MLTIFKKGFSERRGWGWGVGGGGGVGGTAESVQKGYTNRKTGNK